MAPDIVTSSNGIDDLTLSSNSLSFHLRATGPVDGPLVLLLHGFPDLSNTWDDVLPGLAAAGFRAIAPDLRGYGRTDRPPTGYDLDTLAADIAGLIEASGRSRAHVVGHDWGALVAYHLAATRPERVDRLAIVNGPHPIDFLQRVWRPRQLLRSSYTLFFQLPWLPERWIAKDGGAVVRKTFKRFVRDRTRLTDERLDRYAHAMSTTEAARAGLAYYRALFRQFPRRLLTAKRYPRLRAPLLIAWGTADLALGPELATGMNHWSDAPVTVRWLDGVGHFVPLEAPERLTALLVEHFGTM